MTEHLALERGKELSRLNAKPSNMVRQGRTARRGCLRVCCKRGSKKTAHHQHETKHDLLKLTLRHHSLALTLFRGRVDYEIRQGVLDLVFSILKAHPTIGSCHDREGKVLHVLQPQSVLGRTFGNLVLQLAVLFFQLRN